jgi:hypothetical protein
MENAGGTSPTLRSACMRQAASGAQGRAATAATASDRGPHLHNRGVSIVVLAGGSQARITAQPHSGPS